ncbi:hypothetical protein H2199_009024 [Coniosporium tulheliwenetii]|uniref:Uncharacterized protein n=1 Tax=Coniosporium tulheliwenetii TaxID=3383036 RepID=A0ACC2YGJ3_9PEZI|nr:hypothetical protein H2199_009024 [Cladosporium sp. JES 115]
MRDPQLGAGYLDDKQWAKIMRNCGVFYGWIVDRQKDRIVRAPKPAFQLRSKILEDPISRIPDYTFGQPSANATSVAASTNAVQQDDKSQGVSNSGTATSRTSSAGDATAGSSTAGNSHLFCQNLTLGGRLQSTKIIKSNSYHIEQEQKEQFKVSVGVSVSTPFGVSGSVKHEQEWGSTQSESRTDKKTEESNVFEAVGGDTVLANNPPAWAPTVTMHEYWRVINRDALVPLADVLSSIPGYREVKGWFIQAIPAVSKFIELDESRQVMTRFRLMAPLNNLSLKDRQGDAAYYLGHTPQVPATPRLMSLDVKTFGNFWNGMIEYKEEIPLFSPRSYHAPVLLGVLDNKVGSVDFGTKYNEEYAQTEWRIIAPFSDALTHGSRVILCNYPYVDPNAERKPDSPPPPAPAHMVVFRNQQGVFLPAMSERDEYQYWRILKNGATAAGEHIKEGDEIRLCWAFSDQTTGFRDYSEDVFGRRRNQCPPELESSVLYMKLPWPRFESQMTDPKNKYGLPSPNSMVMVPLASTEPEAVDMKVLPAKGELYRYVMQDVGFRIDTVANNGLGDTGDYMLDVEQEGKRGSLTLSYRPFGISMISAAFYF